MKKYIRFYITLGGDAGWRFTNGEEWNSIMFALFFDADIWTMESIKKELDKIDNDIYKDRHHGSTLDEKGECGAKHLTAFFNANKGIYTNDWIWGSGDCLPSAENITKDQIIDWNLNGNYRNYVS